MREAAIGYVHGRPEADLMCNWEEFIALTIYTVRETANSLIGFVHGRPEASDLMCSWVKFIALTGVSERCNVLL